VKTIMKLTLVENMLTCFEFLRFMLRIKKIKIRDNDTENED